MLGYILNYCLQEFNLDTCKSEIQPVENWSEKATSHCMEWLTSENVTKTTFQIKAECEKCYFGDVCYETATSKKLFNIADALKQMDEAVDIDFEPGMTERNIFPFIEQKSRVLIQCHFNFCF